MNNLYYFLKIDLTSADLAAFSDFLRSQREWSHLLALLRSEGLNCFAYQRLKDNNLLPLVPLEIVRQLENDFYSNVKHNLLYAQSLADLAAVFKQKNIPLITLKGAFLGEIIYHNIGVRSMYDMDILVPRAEVLAVDTVLRASGYETKQEVSFLLAKVTSINSAVYAGHNTVIHVHWHLINTTWPLDYFVETIKEKEIFAQAVDLKLAPEHLVIYFCLHALTHFFEKLVLALDIAQLVRVYKGKLDWEKIRKCSEEWGVWPAVYAALLFVSENTSLEMKNIQTSRPFCIGGLKYCVNKIARGKRSYFLSYALYFFLLPDLGRKVRFISRTLFPPRQVLAHSLRLTENQIRFSHYLKRLRIL